ncbi:MAG TPA: TFIIB-type zinc ribbon-containing protein [Candidatus Norongarragalinales archaeon]|nr:TFIIB-type zinc ribbon-containing protein [Candidatus Norongarragalinales archaeon]
MADVACPNCGNPNLDVDAENSVVYCKRCGFSVHVDPETGETQTLNPGGSVGGQQAQPYAGTPGAPRTRVLGMDPFLFFSASTVVLLALLIMNILSDITIFAILEAIVIALYFWRP